MQSEVGSCLSRLSVDTGGDASASTKSTKALFNWDIVKSKTKVSKEHAPLHVNIYPIVPRPVDRDSGQFAFSTVYIRKKMQVLDVSVAILAHCMFGVYAKYLRTVCVGSHRSSACGLQCLQYHLCW